MDLVYRNEEGAGGDWPIGTMLLQAVLERLERVPRICGRAPPSILNDISVDLISLRLIRKEIMELCCHMREFHRFIRRPELVD
jgi:hypothetical protein